jgi:DNA-binding NtrC family response regulator
MMTARRLEVLIVDDDPAIRRQLRGVLEDEGHAVSDADSGERALEAVEESRFDVILLDLQMPGLHGLDVLACLRERTPETAVIVVTGESTLENALRAGQRGAFDFIVKPPDPAHLLAQVLHASRVTGIRGRTGSGDSRAPAPDAQDTLGILGASLAIATLRDHLRRIAPANGRVLITGENGVGKELVAAAIHALSRRADGPFVKLNCAAIPRDLVESELFGHERGAFTGAVQPRKGRFELADGGTLFLDEIGDLSADSQAKLLRTLETGEYERVGGARAQRADVRVVSATNKDLAQAIEAGEFREDLFHRLKVFPVHVPPLRERRGDVALLAAHFLAEFGRAEERPPATLSAEALRLLEEYHWPGNVRELRNLMERAAVLCEGAEVRAEDLAGWLEAAPGGDRGMGLRAEVEKREADAIRRALEQADGNVTQAAAGLGIDRTNLHRKMRKYGIDRR